MKLKRILALLLALALVFTFAACGSDEDADDNTQAVETEAVDDVDADETDDADDEETTIEDATQDESLTDVPEQPSEGTSEAAGAPEDVTTVSSVDLSSKEGVVAAYIEAAKKTETGKVATNSKMSLESLDGGSGAIGSFVNLFKPIARSALEKNSTPDDKLTGGYENLTAADVSSATAKDDGKFTVITIKLKDQVDGVNGVSENGSVGHGVSVLGGIDSAINELSGVEIDYSEGTIKLTYTNASINVKIDNATGRIVSGTWGYNVNVLIDNVTAKIGFLSPTLKGATGVINYTINM